MYDITDKTVILTLDYLTNSSTIRENIIQMNSNNLEIGRIFIQLTSCNILNSVSLISQLDSGCVKIIIRVSFDAIIFLDNINLKIQ